MLQIFMFIWEKQWIFKDSGTRSLWQLYAEPEGGRGSSPISKYSELSDLKSISQGLLKPGTAGAMHCPGSHRDANKE